MKRLPFSFVRGTTILTGWTTRDASTSLPSSTALASVCWQELAPPSDELTAPAERDACHKTAPRASTLHRPVRPPAPVLTSSMGYRCYTCAMQRGPTLRVCCNRQVLLFRRSSSDTRCSCWQVTLALQRKRERMDANMAMQEYVALARSLLELHNNRHSDPAWLDRGTRGELPPRACCLQYVCFA